LALTLNRRAAADGKHRDRHVSGLGLCHWLGLLLVLWMFLVSQRAEAAGTWTRLIHNAPDTIQLMLLLPDGTVMAGNGGGNGWYRLTPDSQGSYVNGTWTTLASMHDTRLYFSSDVLTDGRVFVAGGEYGTGTNSAEVYDPLSDIWTMCPPPPAGQKYFFDSISKILPDGNVLIAPVNPATSGGTVIYNSASNSWIVGPKLFRGFYQDEASWVKLPDDSILTIDPFGIHSERYIPSLNQWVNDSDVPVQMYDSFGFELGAAFLLPDGEAIFFGATGHNAIYTPSGTTSPGTWSAAADFPNNQGTPDAAAAMMVNGKILCATSPTPTSADHFPVPTSFYEYDYVSNTFTQVGAPGGGTTLNDSAYVTLMLDLPDGSVLYSQFSSRLYVYRPAGSPLAAGKPAITCITRNSDGSFHLTGTQLNGISEGAAYGDDNQMDSNYPLVRLTNSAGNVYYCRTYNWSLTSVMTGNTPVTTEFKLPANLPAGTYSLAVVANGIGSDTISFSTLPPVITAQLQDQTVFQGDNATLSVTATGATDYQWQFGGGPLPGATNSTLLLTNVGASQAGTYFVVLTNLFGPATSSNATLTVIPTVPLPVALDATDLVWTTDGTSTWHGLTNISHDGVAAGQSGFITNNQLSRLQTAVTGPGTLTFWWKVSSQTNSDSLACLAGGVPQAAISGEVDWTQQTIYLGSGNQTLQWVYSKDAGGSAGQDEGWVDQVSYTAGGTMPFITTQPGDQVAGAGGPASFSVIAAGTPDLQYQWQFNDADITGATNSSLLLTQALATNVGLYSVVVSNSFGFAISSNALLSVVPVAAFGNDSFGQTGVLISTTNAVAISAGGYHNLALNVDGSVVAWGNNNNGQCTIPDGLTNVVAIAAGGLHSLALLEDGIVVGWGDDSSGQTDVPATAANAIAVAAGGSHSLALRADGIVVAWGDNSWGQTNVPDTLSNVVAIAAGGQHSLALKSDDTVVAWGGNLGPYGNYGGQVDVPFDLGQVVAVAAGGYHSLGIKVDGTVAAWGDNTLNQTSVSSGLSNVVAIAAGDAHSLALKSDGTLVGWGDNSFAQISVPTNIASVIAVAAGTYHSLVLSGLSPGALQLMNPVLNGNAVSIPLPTSRGKAYFLEYKNSLADNNWIILSAVAGNGSMKTLADTAPSASLRFYRVRLQ
jgi:hypothetical protein